MQAAEIVQEARNNRSGLPSEQALHLLTYQEEGATGDRNGIDPPAKLRAWVLEALQNTLTLKDGPLIRFRLHFLALAVLMLHRFALLMFHSP